ncbi:FadR/GntR family transcriptional regulator [Antrihabitans sp. YC2-6]|uniref:FadR/GntR family transcriptional regulator n=1 Tax=Antrihabitans sp. YC2-6 TaxID=2799498 RepID=UPI0018F5965B|nr:FadR/GntR family transcriptional regulator [Antrihabitans sp. YC2-6]MBJ8348279.1 FadR family transcriptional regulator [Antrihabitans sp. YC2-6]
MTLPNEWATRSSAFVRRNATESVFEDLRASIESAELPIGVKLPPEAALAERYSVSRSVIREALRSLQTLGLTSTKTGSGTVVIASSVSGPNYGRFSTRDLLEARPYIEVPAAGWAARRRTNDQLAELRSIVEQMDSEEDPARWVDLDFRFHLAIANASGNHVFSHVVADIRDALAEQSRMLNATIAERREASNAEHRRLYDAIESGDFADASNSMRQHLDKVEEIIVRVAGIGSDSD